ncbi:MAG: beta-(1-6) glucans synthase [Pseudolabrys sp.]|nr:beta-(1-6) glucans synthase [Pseudolabrys sp.]
MRLVFILFAASAAIIGGTWAWLGQPIAMPAASLGAPGKLYCVSYAPFRGTQTPLKEATRIPPDQIEDDLTRLARITDCIRTYSTDYGLEQVPAIAAKHGLKVLQGVWVSSNPVKTATQIDMAVSLATRFPDTVTTIIVGNEVLLRGEMRGGDLAQLIRGVKARVKVPVTYADVWEFLLRNPDVAAATDFITIHILPYWEDFPIAARNAGAHVDAIRAQVARAFPGKEILIGEFGWPSAGRMREGALPSPFNQARVIQDVLSRARTQNYRVNVIEAFDQPWKRAFEGTVGGHWGLLDGGTRDAKFKPGEAVSNHRNWIWQALAGMVFALIVFGAGFHAARRDMPSRAWGGVAACATAGGILIGWTLENIPLESLGPGGWSRSLAIAAVALAAPPLGAAMLTSGQPMPAFAAMVGPREQRVSSALVNAYGVALIAFTVLAVMVALGLVFDPRYHDFPFAPFTVAVVPFALHGVMASRGSGPRAAAELTAGILLTGSAVYIAINETFANWQSLWLCATLLALAFTLVRARDAQG